MCVGLWEGGCLQKISSYAALFLPGTTYLGRASDETANAASIVWRSWACTFGSRALLTPASTPRRIVGLPIIGPAVRPVHNTSNTAITCTECFRKQSRQCLLRGQYYPGSDACLFDAIASGIGRLRWISVNLQNVTQAITITMLPLMRHEMCPAPFNIKNRFATLLHPSRAWDGFERWSVQRLLNPNIVLYVCTGSLCHLLFLPPSQGCRNQRHLHNLSINKSLCCILASTLLFFQDNVLPDNKCIPQWMNAPLNKVNSFGRWQTFGCFDLQHFLWVKIFC